MKFKIGDKVRVKKPMVSNDVCCISRDMRDMEGGVFTITGMNYVKHYELNDERDCFHEDYLESISDTPNREFKVGDRVECEHDETGTVRHIAGRGAYLIEHDTWEDGYCDDVFSGYSAKKRSLFYEAGLKLLESPDREEVKEEKEETIQIRYTSPLFVGGTSEMLTLSELEDHYDKAKKSSVSINLVFGDGTGTPNKISSPKTFMRQLKTIASKLLDADIKALVKAGWLDEELEITPSGQQAVLAHVLLENKVELAKEARKIIKERKNEEEE